MAKLFIIVNSNRPRFGALTNRFCTGDPGAINTYVDWLKTILEVIKSRSHIVDGLPTAKPSALRGSAPRSQYRMCGRILKKYDPRDKDALFESISAL